MASGLGGFSLSSFLENYEATGSTTATGGPSGASNPIANGRSSSDPRKTIDSSSSGARKDRPAPIGVPGRGLDDKRTASPLNTFTPPISKALDDASEKKRKLEGGDANASKKARFEGLTREEKIEKIKRLKALKAAREAAKTGGASGNNSGSAPSNPNSPITSDAPKKAMTDPSKKPAKGTFAEIMERAKKSQELAAAQATKIVHKDHKVEKKKLGAKVEKPAIGKKPVPGASATSKPINGKPGTSSLAKSPAKGSLGRSAGSKIAEPVKPAPAKPKAPVVEWKGTARPTASAKPSSSKPAGRSERERDRGRDYDRDERRGYRDRSPSWEREPRGKPRVYEKRYVYADSDEYDDESDMEADADDILDEEEYSHKAAIKEDIEAEKLEKKLAAEKARKRAMGRR